MKAWTEASRAWGGAAEGEREGQGDVCPAGQGRVAWVLVPPGLRPEEWGRHCAPWKPSHWRRLTPFEAGRPGPEPRGPLSLTTWAGVVGVYGPLCSLARPLVLPSGSATPLWLCHSSQHVPVPCSQLSCSLAPSPHCSLWEEGAKIDVLSQGKGLRGQWSPPSSAMEGPEPAQLRSSGSRRAPPRLPTCRLPAPPPSLA